LAGNINQTIEDLQHAIEEMIEKSGQCCLTAGQSVDSPASLGETSVGPGEQFPDESEYFDAKCNASNAIFDTVRETVSWLDVNNVDLLAGAFGGITSGIALALILSGPVGWAIELVAVTLVAVSALLMSGSFNFEDMRDALDDVHSDAVLALYNAGSASEARDGFVAEVAASAISTTAIERLLITMFLTNAVLNQLFLPRSDTAVYQSPSPINCPTAWSHTFDFTINDGGWTNDTIGGRPFGVYSAGNGWQSVWGSVGGLFDERLYLRRAISPDTHIQSVRVTYEFVGTMGGGREVGVAVWLLGTRLAVFSEPPTQGSFIHYVTFSNTSDAITTSSVADAPSDGDVDATITEIVVTGTGSDPF